MHFIGVMSLAIVLVSGLFIGMVLGLQGFTILVDFGAEDALGQMVALSLLRELAPVVAALLFAGRAGSALTAEIGLMKATEQLTSMEMIGSTLASNRGATPLGGVRLDAVADRGVQRGRRSGAAIWSACNGWACSTARTGATCKVASRSSTTFSTACSRVWCLVSWSPGSRYFRAMTWSHVGRHLAGHDPHGGLFVPGGARTGFRADRADVWRTWMKRSKMMELGVGTVRPGRYSGHGVSRLASQRRRVRRAAGHVHAAGELRQHRRSQIGIAGCHGGRDRGARQRRPRSIPNGSMPE